VKRTFIGMVEAGEPLMRQALEAIRQAHEAEDAGLPDLEVQRLHLLADSLYQAVIDRRITISGCQRVSAQRSGISVSSSALKG